MFTFYRRFRRQIAIITALSLLATVLVAAPAVAADPKADYKATFDACADAPSSGFSDVPMGHANAGDIDCIAYYGITKGTSTTTYSPLMGVSREHMALFLTRLAKLVGITVASNPSDPGFTDIEDLSAESQTAIAQLADLGITTGTSMTTYSPEDNVKRGHMALFIQRLMNKMTPFGGSKSTWAHTPSDVVAVEDDTTTADKDETVLIGSPYTDLGSATKNEYDAITELWELGVASGISDTAYAPGSDITRAAMAGFMAGLLDHSNARPAGVSIQASQTSGFGGFTPTVMVSYRSDSFVPMEDIPIQVFSLTGTQSFNDDGTCPTEPPTLRCDWSANSTPTDTDGNFNANAAAVANGASVTYYAWMGDADNTKFDNDTANAVSVKISSTTDATGVKVTTDINKNNKGTGADSDNAEEVNLNADSSVTFTVQLVSGEGASQADVAKPDVKITVGLIQNSANTVIYRNNSEATLTTDKDGKATFTISGPTPVKAITNQEREDQVTFDGPGDTNPTTYVKWHETTRAANSVVVDVPKYVIRDANKKVAFRVDATLYDQYGDGIDSTSNATISGGAVPDNTTAPVNNRGGITYSYSGTQADDLNDVTVSVAVGDVSGSGTVAVVQHAADDSSVTTDTAVTAVYHDDNRFLIGENLYTYDSGDTFLDGQKVIDMAAFKKALVAGENVTNSEVRIPIYDDDGVSIFKITN